MVFYRQSPFTTGVLTAVISQHTATPLLETGHDSLYQGFFFVFFSFSFPPSSFKTILINNPNRPVVIRHWSRLDHVTLPYLPTQQSMNLKSLNFGTLTSTKRATTKTVIFDISSVIPITIILGSERSLGWGGGGGRGREEGGRGGIFLRSIHPLFSC